MGLPIIDVMDRAAEAARSAEALDRLARDLGTTIRRALAESPQIEQCLRRIHAAGYDVSLSLEATLGFSRGERAPRDERGFDVRVDRDDPPSLKISVDDEE